MKFSVKSATREWKVRISRASKVRKLAPACGLFEVFECAGSQTSPRLHYTDNFVISPQPTLVPAVYANLLTSQTNTSFVFPH